MRMILQAAQVIDGTGKPPYRPGTVVVQQGRIEAVGGADTPLPPGTVVDLGERTLLPGLIDAHLHLRGRNGQDALAYSAVPDATQGIRAVAEARTLLQAGFTTVRCLGGRAEIALRDAIREGLIPGPRIVAAGLAITQAASRWYIDGLPPDQQWVRLAYGPTACRRAVQACYREGSDLIKICTSSGTTHAWGKRPVFTLEEVQAITDEAHRLGLPVTCHCMGDQGVRTALAGGVDYIEHGYGIDDTTRELMLQKGVTLIPTLWLGYEAAKVLPGFQEIFQQQLVSLRRCHAMGIPIALGTDCTGVSWLPHGKNAREFELMVLAGLSPMETIVAGTQNAARVLGLADRVGTLEPGKWADIIAVDADPLQEITALQAVSFVMQGGKIIKSPLQKEEQKHAV
ncbi:MAG: amidohydrolase family protein [Nitrospinota bacterium]|nr:MAG: amidohydrolase family protein [Nitrospinota bacterium]